jgi:Predicted nucleoside-diphosphate sugar epimerases
MWWGVKILKNDQGPNIELLEIVKIIRKRFYIIIFLIIPALFLGIYLNKKPVIPYEELLMAEEGLQETRHNKIFIGRPTFNDIDELKRKFDEMRLIIEHGSKEEVIKKVEELVPTYKPMREDQSNTMKREIATTFNEDIDNETAN